MISSENESIDEIKRMLLCTKLELLTARMEANTEIKKYEETIKHLYKLLKRVCQERDEARDQLQLLLRNFKPSTPAETSTIMPQVNHPKHQQYKTKSSMKSTKVSDMSSKAFSNCLYDLSLASFQSNEKHSSMALSHTRIAESNKLSLPKQPNHQDTSRDNIVDSSSLMIDKLVCGKPLPQKGRLLQTVTEAGPLLQTLLVAPLPQWQNPPPLSSSGLQLSGIQDNNSETSLSLAFPGNSRGPSQMSSASTYGLSVKNEEPMSYMDMDSNRMHNHILTGKKRKLL